MQRIKEVLKKNIVIILYVVEFLFSILFCKSILDFFNTKAYSRILSIK